MLVRGLIRRDSQLLLQMLKLATKELEKLEADQVRVRWMGAPINPADINQVQGVYPVKPPLPAVGGIEGFGEIEEVIPPNASQNSTCLFE